MPDAHLILVPSGADAMRAALAEAHLMAAARYVALNPVRAGLAAWAEDWRWSSARAHLEGRDGGLVSTAPRLERESDWRAFPDQGLGEDELAALRAGERTGRPLGSEAFVAALERHLDRPLPRRKPGPKPAAVVGDQGR